MNVLNNGKNDINIDSNETKNLLAQGERLLEEAPAKSLDIADKLLNSLKVNPATEDYLKALYLRASANSYLENYGLALTDFKTCNSNKYFTADTILLADLKFNMAHCYDCLANIEEALKYYQEALNLYQARKNIYGQAKILQNIGIIESDRRRDSLAMNYYNKALELYRLVDNKAKEAAILQNIGVVYLNQEKYPKTIDYYTKALKIFHSIRNTEGIASVENNLGLAYERQQMFEKALKHYQNALINFQRLNSRTGMAYVYDNLGSLYGRLKKTDVAVTNYKLSLMYADSVHILDFMAYVNKELADLYEMQGNYEKSLLYYKTASELEDSINNSETRKKLSETEAYFHNELKDVEIQKKEFQLETQKREKKIYLSGVVLLLLMLAGLIWAYHKKLLAENKLKKHQEVLKEEVQVRTKELKEEILERKAAEEADKLKTAFLANMSHEIRTPMNAILAFSNFLKDSEISGAQRNEYIKYINSCSISLLHLIDDILDTAKIEARQLKIHSSPCYVNSILNELYVYFQNHRKCIEGDVVLNVQTECLAKNYEIVTDSTRLRQVFTNLLDNAFKFTDKGSIEFGFKLKEGVFEFYVSDTGTGIPKDKTEIVFKRFGQVNDNSQKIYKGTGLGLSISKHLVELLGGKMWLESKEGKGSSFYFTIPATNLKMSELLENLNEEYISARKLLNWKDYSILVAEDDDLNFKLIQIALAKTQANIIRAKNGEEVLNTFAENRNIHAVLMDIQMPVLDGYETTRRLKRLHNDIFVIAQTAFAMSDDKDKCLEAGCDDYISKPIDFDELYKKLGYFLEKVEAKKS